MGIHELFSLLNEQSREIINREIEAMILAQNTEEENNEE
jgi:hypothetical protein